MESRGKPTSSEDDIISRIVRSLTVSPAWESRLGVGLVFGLVLGLDFGLALGLDRGLDRGLVGGLVFGLCAGLDTEMAGVGLSDNKIECVETVNWSWPENEDLFGVLLAGLVFGLFGMLLAGLVFGLDVLLKGRLSVGRLAWNALFVGLVFGLVLGLGVVLKEGLSFGRIETRNIPNQGIHRSAWNALFGGLFVGLVLGLVGGLVNGQFVGLYGGLVYGLKAGGQACLKHLALRLSLVRSGSIPWNYIKFLDHAAERILLRKVGGGYVFIHRMLLEYFAARYDESAVEATPNAEQF